MARVLLISPPWRMPDDGALALATLRPLLTDAGIETDTLHGTQLFARTPTDRVFLSNYAGHLFVPSLYPEAEPGEVLDTLLARFLDDLNLEGLVRPGSPTLADFGIPEDALRAALRDDLARAAECVDACVAHALDGGYAAIGLSATFESQLTAALAIARRIHALAPDVSVALGGAACFESPAAALAASFPELDAVCHCEGEAVVVPLIEALLIGSDLNDVPGIAFRDADGHVRTTPSPPLLRDLDRLPIPDYDDFVAALGASPWSDLPPKLFFETSRGCWWGQKQLCTFCGLNADGLPFRRKSPARAIAEIETLHERYPTARRLQATDNILDVGYFDAVLPALAQARRGLDSSWRLFYELKSNVRKGQVQALAEAGVDLVQPGIESFHDGVLDLMRKGNTALGQVQFLKWAYECGVGVTYNILVRSPGEQAHWYRELTALIDTICHLPPPDVVTPVWLERFSPYHSSPAAYGLERLRAKPHYRSLYRDVPVALERLAYVFDFDHAMLHDDELIAAQRALVRRVGRWQSDWRPRLAGYVDDGEAIDVIDERFGEPRRTTLLGLPAQVFRFLDRIRSRRRLGKQFPSAELDAALERLRGARWAHAAADRYLVVLPNLRETSHPRTNPEAIRE